jgi:hypothetical protein
MRAKSAIFLLVIAALLSPHRAYAQCFTEESIGGYQYWPDLIITPFSTLYPKTPPGGTGPAGAYSANPNTHIKCTTQKMSDAQYQGINSAPPQPNNTALAIPLRLDNPVDIVNASTYGAQNGGTPTSTGFMSFPHLANGVNASVASAGHYAAAGYTILGLINVWAPPQDNPNAVANTLSGLGISTTIAGTTHLSALTSTQLLQVIAAFGWQEGFKPTGC